MAREMDVPLSEQTWRHEPSHAARLHRAARGRLLPVHPLLLASDRSEIGQQTNSLSSEKKVFFADPLLHTIALEQAPGLTADIPALIENAVGLALYRSYEPPERLIESFISPDRLHAWRTARAGEVDFVAGPRRQLDAVEVKYQRHIDSRGAPPWQSPILDVRP